ncbi:MAG TPA: Ku protein [Candidatus Solibacter sp.]|jgi:DNA end-binding protein Ku|nr:Ku protein [Candidatus Solibacter sp.]
MPRSMWKGAISFGMVAIPVRLYLATESKSVSFRSLCPCHKQPIKQKRHCPVDDEVLDYKDVVRGFEISKDTFVVMDEEDFDNLPLASAHTIDIAEFVDGDAIPAELYMKQAYYLEPEKVGVKPYYLMREALKDMGKVAVGKIALRDREHMATMRPFGKGMIVNSLHWPDEIRSMDDLNLPEDEVKIDKREMAMAKMLIENLSDEFDPERYHDEYREAIIRVAQAKADGEEISVVEPETPKVMDLMAALKASVEASKRGGASDAAEDDGASAKPRVVKGRTSRSRSGDAVAEKAEEKPRRRVAKAS